MRPVCLTALLGIGSPFEAPPLYPALHGTQGVPQCCIAALLCRSTLRRCACLCHAASPPSWCACSRLLEDKDGYVLYTVVVLKKYVESFRNDCRNKKFPVRDFTYVPEHAGSGLSKIEKLEADLQETLVGGRRAPCPSSAVPRLYSLAAGGILIVIVVVGGFAYVLQSHLQDQCVRKFADVFSVWLHLKVQRLQGARLLPWSYAHPPPPFGQGFCMAWWCMVSLRCCCCRPSVFSWSPYCGMACQSTSSRH